MTDPTATPAPATTSTAPADDAHQLPEPVVREHSITVDGKPLAYTTTTGLMPIRDDKGELQARLFFTYYQVVDADATEPRPLTIAFNGGPGSASVWLHMGGLAPRRVAMLEDGGMPKPPFKLVDNEYTWLPETDIVFVDPVDTGYSRAVSDEAGKKMKGQQGDIAAANLSSAGIAEAEQAIQMTMKKEEIKLPEQAPEAAPGVEAAASEEIAGEKKSGKDEPNLFFAICAILAFLVVGYMVFALTAQYLTTWEKQQIPVVGFRELDQTLHKK